MFWPKVTHENLCLPNEDLGKRNSGYFALCEGVSTRFGLSGFVSLGQKITTCIIAHRPDSILQSMSGVCHSSPLVGQSPPIGANISTSASTTNADDTLVGCSKWRLMHPKRRFWKTKQRVGSCLLEASQTKILENETAGRVVSVRGI